MHVEHVQWTNHVSHNQSIRFIHKTSVGVQNIQKTLQTAKTVIQNWNHRFHGILHISQNAAISWNCCCCKIVKCWSLSTIAIKTSLHKATRGKQIIVPTILLRLHSLWFSLVLPAKFWLSVTSHGVSVPFFFKMVWYSRV